jgi:hypothetical protein
VNVHGVNNITQTEIHTSELLASEYSSFEVETATDKLERYSCQVPIKFQQNLSKQVMHYTVRTTNMFYLEHGRNAKAVKGKYYCACL